jgi:hypothetical protein
MLLVVEGGRVTLVYMTTNGYSLQIPGTLSSYPLSNISFRFYLCGSYQSHESLVATAEFCVVCGSKTPSCVYRAELVGDVPGS